MVKLTFLRIHIWELLLAPQLLHWKNKQAGCQWILSVFITDQHTDAGGFGVLFQALGKGEAAWLLPSEVAEVTGSSLGTEWEVS